jgi:hypothetical protein
VPSSPLTHTTTKNHTKNQKPKDTLGDFVILRSNGLPVYNFCVAVDDALMGITHVLRAEEHLPNTLRQLLIYRALGFAQPVFGHMSLILAPDKSKLSKRHGATSVGEFKQQGYLAPAMVNYLSLLGWNDGTEREIYGVDDLAQAFSVERITKVCAFVCMFVCCIVLHGGCKVLHGVAWPCMLFFACRGCVVRFVAMWLSATCGVLKTDKTLLSKHNKTVARRV